MSEAGDPVTQGTLRSAAGQILPLEHTSVRATIAGPLAEVVVRQRFRNPGADPIEAVYLFPLPGEASVYRMEFHIADRVVRAVVKEKEEARRIYARAQSEGRAATLLEEDRPSLFSLSIANVAPGAVIEVELAYFEMVAFDDGHFRFVFPMVGPERYRDGPAPATPGEHAAALPPPRLPTGERGPDVAIEVHVRASRPVEHLRCVSHPTQAMDPGDGSVQVRLPPDLALPNRDFVLTWQAGTAGVRPFVRFERTAGETGTLLMLLTPSMKRDAEERIGGEGHAPGVRCGNCGGAVTNLADIVTLPGLGPVLPCRFCGAVLAPGTALQTRAVRPRDVLVLVDRSASTRGALAQARRATLALLDQLAEGDCIQVVAFDHERAPFDGDGTRFVALAREVVASVDRFLGGLSPRGGTELLAAIEHTARLPAREGRTRAVVLITDAAAGNEGLLLRRVPEILGASTRLFVLGVGPAVDRRLVARLAQAGGGAHDVILPGEDVEVTLTRFARRVREGGPILTNLTAALEGAVLEDACPTPLPDLFGGQPVRLLARFHATGPAKLVLNGLTAEGKPYRHELPLDLPAESHETPGLVRLWAKHHVEALAARIARDPGQAVALRTEATLIALSASLVGPFTSLVAEDSEVSVAPTWVRSLRLVVADGDDQGKTLVLDGIPRQVGRAPSCDLVLTALRISRIHFDVHFADGAFVLRDVDSVNGTTVDGAPVRTHRLAPGQRIVVAETPLVVEAMPEGPDAYFRHVPQRRVEVASALPDAGDRPEAPPPAPGAAGSAPRLRSPAAYAPAAPAAGRPAAGRPPAGFLLGTVLDDDSTRLAQVVAPPPAFGGPPPGFGPPPFAPPPFAPPPFAPSPFAPPPAAFPAPPPLYFAPPSPPPPAPPVPPPPRAPLPQGRQAAPQAPLGSSGSEPYPESELLWLRDRLRGELDLVFLVDATASMAPYIDQVRARLLELVDALRASPLCKSLRIGLVTYRDHPPQELSFVSRSVALTDDIPALRNEVLQLGAAGGGDGPEAVTDGLFDVVRLAWRASAAKAVVWFGDAPPHGVEPTGDGFPAGCPCGNHWYAQAESCREMGVAIYAIGCLPALRGYVGAEAVFRTVARASRGMFLPLREAGLLVPMIAGAAESELDRQRIDEHVAEVVKQREADLAATDEGERVRWLVAALRARGVRARGMAANEEGGASPLRFREVEPGDVEGALGRLRGLGRVAV